MLSVRIPMRKMSNVLDPQQLFHREENLQARLKCFLQLSILPWNQELSLRQIPEVP